MTINAFEQGRNLHVVVGAKEDGILFVVKPLNTEKGARILAQWTQVLLGLNKTPEDAETTAINFTREAVGEENFERLSELRWAEGEKVANAAFLWNVQGGGIELVQEMLVDGFPKARESLMKATGLADAYSQLLTLQGGVSGLLTQLQGDTPDTNIRSGISDSSGGTVPPENKK